MRLAIYARVSTKDTGQGVTDQLRELREFVARKSGEDWTLVNEYVDEASGKTGD